MTLSDQVAALSRTLDTLTHGEVKHVFVSNAGGKPSTERWTITAFGESYEAMPIAMAHQLLLSWEAALGLGDARELTTRELRSACRGELTRNLSGQWTFRATALDGPPRSTTWITPTSIDDSGEAQELADSMLAKEGFTRLWTWISDPGHLIDPNRVSRFITIVTKG